jgi:hypothetical protein
MMNRAVFGLCRKMRAPVIARSAFRTFAAKTVTVEDAKKMPKDYYEMPNDILLTMAVMGDQDARSERLIREIMSVDNTSWEDSQSKFQEIVTANRRGNFLMTLPYKVGIVFAMAIGVVSIPMIYDLETVEWFNELYVTSDRPEDKDLETPLEVSNWAWNWMEPSMGTASFVLLCMQWSRAQLQNIDAKPYTHMIMHRRARRIAREFPTYNAGILEDWSMGDPLSVSKKTLETAGKDHFKVNK